MISGNALRNVTHIKNGFHWFKEKYSPLKIDNITVVKLKTLAKQRGIKGYYKLRKTEMIQKLQAHPDVIEQLLIPGLEIPRNATRSVNTSAILEDPILNDKTPGLQPTPNFIAKSIQKNKDFGNWLLDYIHQDQRWLMKLSKRLRLQLKNCTTRETLPSN